MSARLPASGRGRLSLACYPARRRAQQRRQARARPSRRAISSWGSPMDQAKTPLLNSEAIEARKSIARGTFLVCDMDCADPGCDGGARATRARSVGAAPRAAPRRRNHDAGGGQRGDAGDRFAAAAGVAWLLAEPRRCGLSRQARLEFARGCHRERARLSAAADAAEERKSVL